MVPVAKRVLALAMQYPTLDFLRPDFCKERQNRAFSAAHGSKRRDGMGNKLMLGRQEQKQWSICEECIARKADWGVWG